jgi:micrococcal nuclease
MIRGENMMKCVIKFVTAILLLFGLAACNQEKVSKTSNKNETTVIPATSNAPKNTKNQTVAEVPTGNSDKQTLGAICNSPSLSKNANQFPVIVTETLDGNTIKVVYNGKEETIRYLLVDTPKNNKSGSCEQPYATDAFNRNKQLVHSGPVTIEFEFGKNNIDKDGSILAYVFVNDTSIQETLLKEGLARVVHTDGQRYKYNIPFISSQAAAKNQQLHIWSKADYVLDNGFKQCDGSNVNSKY